MIPKPTQGDVLLEQGLNGGEVSSVSGDLELTMDFRTMAHLCLFGGNREDDGSSGNKQTWWGNVEETDEARKYVSTFQNLLGSIPATSGNLLRLEDAAKTDLSVFISEGIASRVEVAASIPALNKIKIDGIIEARGVETEFSFTENWRSFQ